MPADWLAVTERGASQPVVSRYVGGFNRNVLSAPFGTNLGSDDIEEVSPFNCAYQDDDDTLYAVLFDGLYRSTDGGLTFAVLFSFASPATDLTRRICHGGLHLAYDQGSSELILGGWIATSIGFTISGWTYRLSDGANSQTNQTVNVSNDEICGSEILYGTSVHFNYGSGISQSNWFAFDIAGQSWSDFSVPGGLGTVAAASSCYAVGSDGALYMSMFMNVAGVGQTRLYKFEGAWSESGTIVVTNDTTLENSRDQARMALFSDGLDLHCVTLTGTSPSYGWRHYQVTAASGFDPSAAVNLTATVVPANLRSTADGGTANSNPDKRCIVVQDTQSTPGTLETYLAFSDDAAPGTPYSVQQYQGVGAPYSFIGSGGQVRDAIPQASRNGGGYFFTPAQDGLEILSVAPIQGGELIAFRARAGGGGTATVQFRRSKSQQGVTQLATLFGSAMGGGATRVGDTVTNVPLDGTIVTVPWNFFADTVNNNEGLVVLVPEFV